MGKKKTRRGNGKPKIIEQQEEENIGAWALQA